MRKFQFLAFLIVLFISTTAFGGCLRDEGTIAVSLNCLGLPSIPKFNDPQVFLWKGKEILAVNDGNEIRLWDIHNPHNPRAIAISNFNVPNVGDSDHDLMNYTFGNDVRFNVATFKRGNLVFDLGDGPWPAFGARKLYNTGSQPRGGFAFTKQGSHYIVAQNLPNSCGKSGTIYRVTSPSQLTKVGCIDAGAFNGIQNGWKLWNGNYYLGFFDGSIHLYRWDVATGTLAHVVKTSIKGSSGWVKGISIRGKKVLSADPQQGVKYWKIDNPSAPVFLSAIGGSWTQAAANWTDIFIARDLEATFDTTLPRSPTPLDQYFWDPRNPWNQYSEHCTNPSGAVFSLNGEVLYYARYSVVQKIDFSACNGGQ